MTALTTSLNKVLPSYSYQSIIVYDYKPNMSVVKFEGNIPSIVQKATEGIVKVLNADYKDSYLLIERENSLIVAIWQTDEEHYNALRDKYTVHLEKLLKVQKQRIEIMTESLPILKEMVALKPKLDLEVTSLTKILKG